MTCRVILFSLFAAVMFTIQEFHRRFRTQDMCLDYLMKLRFRDWACPTCHRQQSFHRHRNKQCYTCTCGRHHVYPRKGTLFENSAVSLNKWFYAIFLMCETSNGIRAKDLEQRLGVTYPTAWRMAKRIRAILPVNDDRQLSAGERFEKCLFSAINQSSSRGASLGHHGPSKPTPQCNGWNRHSA